MTKDIYFDFIPDSTPLIEEEVVLSPLKDDDTEYHSGAVHTQVSVDGDPTKNISFHREHWNGTPWFVTATDGLTRIVCKVNSELDPQPSDEEVARALVAAVYSDSADKS